MKRTNMVAKIAGGVALIAVLVWGMAAAGCTTVADVSEEVGWSNYDLVSNRDFITLGIVVVTAERGKKASSTDLMAEAKRLGADDIINVRIVTQRNEQMVILSSSASATAIKYKSNEPAAKQPTVIRPNRR